MLLMFKKRKARLDAIARGDSRPATSRKRNVSDKQLFEKMGMQVKTVQRKP